MLKLKNKRKDEYFNEWMHLPKDEYKAEWIKKGWIF